MLAGGAGALRTLPKRATERAFHPGMSRSVALGSLASSGQRLALICRIELMSCRLIAFRHAGITLVFTLKGRCVAQKTSALAHLVLPHDQPRTFLPSPEILYQHQIAAGFVDL